MRELHFIGPLYADTLIYLHFAALLLPYATHLVPPALRYRLLVDFHITKKMHRQTAFRRAVPIKFNDADERR